MTYLPALVASSAPAIISATGARASYRFLEFFTAQIRNPHTRRAYARAGRSGSDARSLSPTTPEPKARKAMAIAKASACIRASLPIPTFGLTVYCELDRSPATRDKGPETGLLWRSAFAA